MEEKRPWEDGSGSRTEEPPMLRHKGEEQGQEELQFPATRRVVMRFASTGQEVPGRIVYRENFGILARAEEDAPPVRANDRFWTKWCGALQPMSLVPVVEVVHAVKSP